MEMHRALGAASRAGCERDDRGIVGGSVDVVEMRGPLPHPGVQRTRFERIEMQEPRCRTAAQCGFEIRGNARVGEREMHVGPLDDLRQFAPAEQRHGGHRDASRLEHREPARHQHGLIGRAQQDPAARDQAEFLDQHMRNAIGGLEQPAIGPRSAGMMERDAFPLTCFDPDVEQFGNTVDASRITQLRLARPLHPRPQFERRQMVPDERVDVGGIALGLTHGGLDRQ